ncbi:hypothetical protein [Intrasporangium sp.]|uniref:hypothetical protein n=1 Tax=Intrasporangium sp. TaxID=1925024 RepID=UPI0033659162
MAWSTCATPGTLADSGATLILDGTGKEDWSGDQLDAIDCVLRALSMPAAVEAHINSTRALDGMQNDTWNDISARWTYHPDAGLDITLTLAQ